MALAEICGLNSFIDVKSTNEDDKLRNEIACYSRNFINNMVLAPSPFPNVSILGYTFIGY